VQVEMARERGCCARPRSQMARIWKLSGWRYFASPARFTRLNHGRPGRSSRLIVAIGHVLPIHGPAPDPPCSRRPPQLRSYELRAGADRDRNATDIRAITPAPSTQTEGVVAMVSQEPGVKTRCFPPVGHFTGKVQVSVKTTGGH